MILECSACKARYLVPDTAIGAAGRTVRCAKCSHSWFQNPAPESTEQTLNELDKLLDQVNAKEKPLAPGSNLPVVQRSLIPLRLKLTAAVLTAAAVALFVLMAKPAWFKLPPTKGLEIADLGVSRQTIDKQTTYGISGKISNTTAHSVKMPTLRVTLVDKEGNALQFWDFVGEGRTIEAGRFLPFDTGNLEIRFTKASRFVIEIGSAMELALRRKPE